MGWYHRCLKVLAWVWRPHWRCRTSWDRASLVMIEALDIESLFRYIYLYDEGKHHCPYLNRFLLIKTLLLLVGEGTSALLLVGVLAQAHNERISALLLLLWRGAYDW